MILGASTLPQSVIPQLLSNNDPVLSSWKSDVKKVLERQGKTLCELLAECPGLDVIWPQGAMYAMVRINASVLDGSIADDMHFSQCLLREENVFVLPGKAFGLQATFRVVFCSDEATLVEAASRISAFCKRRVRA